MSIYKTAEKYADIIEEALHELVENAIIELVIKEEGLIAERHFEGEAWDNTISEIVNHYPKRHDKAVDYLISCAEEVIEWAKEAGE